MPALDAASWLNAASGTSRCQLNSWHRGSKRHRGLHDANSTRGIAAQRGFFAAFTMPALDAVSCLNVTSWTSQCQLNSWHRGITRIPRGLKMPGLDAASRLNAASQNWRCQLHSWHRCSTRYRGSTRIPCALTMPALDSASWLNAASRTWRCQLNSWHRCSPGHRGLRDANLTRGITALPGFLAVSQCLLMTRHRGSMQPRRLGDANLTRGIVAQRGIADFAMSAQLVASRLHADYLRSHDACS